MPSASDANLREKDERDTVPYSINCSASFLSSLVISSKFKLHYLTPTFTSGRDKFRCVCHREAESTLTMTYVSGTLHGLLIIIMSLYNFTNGVVELVQRDGTTSDGHSSQFCQC